VTVAIKKFRSKITGINLGEWEREWIGTIQD
jgi:hypothetical protein